MYINLIIGALFLYLLYTLVRRWLRQANAARDVLREEMERERKRRQGETHGADRLREISAQRVAGLARALGQMREELAEQESGRNPQDLLEFEEDGGELYARIGEEGWKVRFEPAQVDLSGGAAGSEDGLFVVEDADGGREVMRDDASVVRHFARRIAKAAQG